MLFNCKERASFLFWRFFSNSEIFCFCLFNISSKTWRFCLICAFEAIPEGIPSLLGVFSMPSSWRVILSILTDNTLIKEVRSAWSFLSISFYIRKETSSWSVIVVFLSWLQAQTSNKLIASNKMGVIFFIIIAFKNNNFCKFSKKMTKHKTIVR